MKRVRKGLFYCSKKKRNCVMAKKDDVKRLQELATMLGREADISGSTAEIRQRLDEWEEEAGSQSDTDDSVGAADQQVNEPAVSGDAEDSKDDNANSAIRMVLIRAQRTLHIDALSADSDRPVEVVKEGEMARISADLLDELTETGLVERV
ncbi:TPA: DNA breaking-rejoining protein [Salmonella enterica]|nr:DNA breaking-rejoining protein [Salmonella enterica subsp. diarizonae]HEA0254967.1 DNA breaking-rejoining protein [Salmonella enterica]ECQ1025697.1 DNA breaking-rejoining protein [Salmonella enterica subsp. diarizonae]EDE1923942.1 DNA breaking-rejoining protein [Salmonella enterica subsp. diarizonae]HEA0273530.1 DNA breaking-rejoining protein [Salmonella enterica]